MTRLMPGEDALRRRAAPPTLPVIMMARMTSICRSVSIVERVGLAASYQAGATLTTGWHRLARRGRPGRDRNQAVGRTGQLQRQSPRSLQEPRRPPAGFRGWALAIGMASSPSALPAFLASSIMAG